MLVIDVVRCRLDIILLFLVIFVKKEIKECIGWLRYEMFFYFLDYKLNFGKKNSIKFF